MAQTGFTPISTYYTTTAGATPTAGNLVNGELAININTADGRLFYKDSAGVVQVLATKDSASGSFTNLSYTGTLTGGTGVVNLGSGQFYKDASGNVGIGTSSPAGKLHVDRGTISSGASPVLTQAIRAGSTTYLDIYQGNNSTIAGQSILGSTLVSTDALAFATNSLERMRIDSSGNVLVGSTTYNGNNTGGIQVGGTAVGAIYIGHATGVTTGNVYSSFNYNGGSIGSITQAGTTGVLYNVTSDYRLKSDVAPIQDALSIVESLNPVSFTWSDGRKDDGFLAHELQTVLPNCVTGEKDETNEDGSPKYQQMDSSGVIPFLVKAIQEQQVMIEELKAKVAALEAA